MIFKGNPAGIKQVFDSLGIADSFALAISSGGRPLSKRIDQFVKDTLNKVRKMSLLSKEIFCSS
jgi:4-hydroxy-tetrahydrodipicolinate synthase